MINYYYHRNTFAFLWFLLDISGLQQQIHKTLQVFLRMRLLPASRLKLKLILFCIWERFPLNPSKSPRDPTGLWPLRAGFRRPCSECTRKPTKQACKSKTSPTLQAFRQKLLVNCLLKAWYCDVSNSQRRNILILFLFASRSVLNLNLKK